MNNTDKAAIVNEVRFLAKMMTQKAVAAKAMVSTATISQMLANNWSLISDDMFRKVQSNLNMDLNWNIAITDNLREVYNFCLSSQMQALALLISDNAGKGKSNGYKYFARRNANVIHVECKASWSKKSFVKQLLISMGVTPMGTAEAMLEKFNEQVKKMEKPLLILDQADKLRDPQLDLFMEFYNDHEGHLGIILSGVDALRKRIDKGCQHSKVGYDELFSRVGRRHISLNPVSLDDVTKICIANDVAEAEDIRTIYDTCGGDFRRVRREIKKIHIAQSKQVELSA